MKSPKINKLLLRNYLRLWDNNFKFNSYITIFSLLINSFSIAIVILIFSVNSGFKENALHILKNITGFTKIYNVKHTFLTI